MNDYVLQQQILLEGVLQPKNLTGPDSEIFKSDSSKFEIGGNDTKPAANINTAGKYSRSVTISKAITITNNPNIQRNIPLNVIFTGSF